MMILLLLIVLGLVGLVIGTVSLISLHKEEVALTHRYIKASLLVSAEPLRRQLPSIVHRKSVSTFGPLDDDHKTPMMAQRPCHEFLALGSDNESATEISGRAGAARGSRSYIGKSKSRAGGEGA